MCCAVFHYRLLFQINKGSHTWPHEPKSIRETFILYGSPAHAGIDPAPWQGDTVYVWLPRTRGDRPFSVTTA